MTDQLVLAPYDSKGRPQVRRERADRLVAALVAEAGLINDDPLLWYDDLLGELMTEFEQHVELPCLTSVRGIVRCEFGWPRA